MRELQVGEPVEKQSSGATRCRHTSGEGVSSLSDCASGCATDSSRQLTGVFLCHRAPTQITCSPCSKQKETRRSKRRPLNIKNLGHGTLLKKKLVTGRTMSGHSTLLQKQTSTGAGCPLINRNPARCLAKSPPQRTPHFLSTVDLPDAITEENSHLTSTHPDPCTLSFLGRVSRGFAITQGSQELHLGHFARGRHCPVGR